jgi:hypothetical protein
MSVGRRLEATITSFDVLMMAQRTADEKQE